MTEKDEARPASSFPSTCKKGGRRLGTVNTSTQGTATAMRALSAGRHFSPSVSQSENPQRRDFSALPVLGQELDPVAAPPAEGEYRSRGQLLTQSALNQSGQTVDAFAHMRGTAGQIHPDVRPRPDHASSTERISARSTGRIKTDLSP
jgi:hypothetical protein